MKKKAWVIVIVCLALMGGGSALYLNSGAYAYDASHFAENTSINEVDCSDMTMGEAAAALTAVWNDRTFSITQDGETIGELSDLDLSYDIEDQLQELLAPNVIEPIKSHLTKEERDLHVTMTPEGSENLDKKIKALEFLDAEYETKTTDAHIDMTNYDFDIAKEVQGDNIDKERFVTKVKEEIAGGNFTLHYDPGDYYALPQVTADDPALAEEQEFLKSHYTQVITYETYDGDYLLQPKYMVKLMPTGEDGKTHLDEDAVTKYVRDTLNKELTTTGTARKFKSGTSGKTLTVEGGDYGYTLDVEKETKALIEDLKSEKSITRKPHYAKTAYCTKGNGLNDIGDSYVEVDLGSQVAYLYRKGKKEVSTPVVTGKLYNHATPAGIYAIQAKQMHTTLRGRNDDGTKYASKVTYWMPFNGGIGLHDASWRGSFGGGIYVSGGSHGCVNMPYWAAAEIYGKVEVGYPVVVHY